ncbi:EAL domain-containing protein [Ideonella sp. A 288]|uniref:EAL domain-containing protein n=1 Tax=Ideonella sp. A 288 TaxID=1962181 RepID=UPI000B4BD21E|nr:GGDEF domain-containing protein [Ideonella sp. A 288]
MLSLVTRSVRQAASALHVSMARTFWVGMAVCVLAAIGLQQWTVREATVQLAERQAQDHGRRIAAVLERVGPQPQRRDAALLQYFDEHRLQRLDVVDASGALLFSRVAPAAAANASAAIERLLVPAPQAVEVALRQPIGAAAGLRIEAAGAESTDWAGRLSLKFLLGMALTLLVVGLVGRWRLGLLGQQMLAWGDRAAASDSVQGGRRSASMSVSAMESQWSATASRSPSQQPGPLVADGPATIASVAPPAQEPPPKLPKEKHLKQIALMKTALSQQARVIEEARLAAHVDTLTGLAKRASFIARLEQALEGEDALPAAGLLLVRVRDLIGVNRRVGHSAANQVLQRVAQALRALHEATPHSAAGRLNGSDFALLMPSDGVARKTADALLVTLRQALVSLDPVGGLAIGAVNLRGRVTVKQALALADEALASAESDSLYAVASGSNSADQPAFGDAVWQQRLADALAHRRTVLGAYPVCGRDDRVLHLDCPMRVQFDEGGPYESAWRWLAPAARGHMGPEIDRRVVEMALEAIRHDGQARCVNMSAQSLASSEFMVRLTQDLEAAPDAARRLWIDLPESLALDRPALVREAARRWNPLGVRLALEHAGENLARIDHLNQLGVDCVRIDGRFLRGITGPESGTVRRHLQGMVRLAHDAGLTISAEGVSAAGDLTMVWALGFDAATGPAVLKRHQSMSPQ